MLEAQLSFQAFHDPLTGLANRRRFIAEVADSIASGTGTGVLFLDLDDFKHVNDEMGHDAGDALLSAVGHRLVRAIRPDDIGCRIGGDEFAVLLPETSELDEAESVAPSPARGTGRADHARGPGPASCRRASAWPSPQPGELIAVDELLRRADVAMYHAKAQGKNRLACYTPLLEPVVGRRAGGGPVRDVARGAAHPSPAPAAARPKHLAAGQPSISGTSTTCEATNQTWSSLRRRTSPIRRSFEPQSPSFSVLSMPARTFSMIVSCASSSR